VQSRGLKTRTSGVAAMGGDSTLDSEHASGPRCGAPSPGARTGTAVAVLSPFVPHRTTPAPALTFDTVEVSGTAVPPPSIPHTLEGSAAAGATSAPRRTPQETVNQFLEFVGAARTPEDTAALDQDRVAAAILARTVSNCFICVARERARPCLHSETVRVKT